MAITADYHLHTHNSGDSTAPMEDMIKKGISLGLTTMCFTEHMDMDYVYEKPGEAGMFELNTDSYLYELATLKEKYEKKNMKTRSRSSLVWSSGSSLISRRS